MVRLKFLFLGWLIILVCSCGFETDPDDIGMGENFVSSQSWLSIVDSFSIAMSTVVTDSVVTSGTGVIWAGSYVDDDLGKITASSFFQIGLPTTVDIEEETDRYDSLTLRLTYNKEYYGDTLNTHELKIYSLAEELNPENNEGDVFYNTSTIPLSNISIGSIVFSPKINKKDILEIRLSDELGLDLFDKFINNDDTISKQARFEDYLPGIALISGSDNTSVLGFSADSTVNIVLHTTRKGKESSKIENMFSIINEEYQFNCFEADRTGTSLAEVQKSKKIPSADCENKTYIQSGFGVYTRIDFPSMQRLLEMDQGYDLFKAELILYPVPGTYQNIRPPKELVAYYTDKYNNVIEEAVDETNNIAITGDYQLDSLYHENTFYTFDITYFIENELSDGYFDTNHGLFIGEGESNVGNTLNRIVFSANKNTAYKPKFKLYFLFFDS